MPRVLLVLIRFSDGKEMGPSYAGLGVLVDQGRNWYICRRGLHVEQGPDGDRYVCGEGTLGSIEERFERKWVAEIMDGDLSTYIPSRSQS